jgi:uncharacterized membrane protein YccC
MATPLEFPAPVAGSLRQFLSQELTLRAGRAATIGRIVIACVATMLLVMTFKLPNGFLAVFFAFSISRDDPSSTVRNGFAIVLANFAGLLLSLAGIVLLADYPLLHFLFAVGIFFLAFFVTRTLANYAVAFGFSIIAVAAASVNIIWARGNPLQPDIGTAIRTSFGMILGTLVAMLIEWMIVPPKDRRATRLPPLFISDAFTNAEHISYALKGCLAATICYVLWSALAWPGIGVSTVTCILAAPVSTSGSSRPRLLTRLAGWFFGGVICGIGSQVLILPSLDSIVGFTLVFAAVSAAAAWVATSSPRFSYFARPMAIAYYLTMFQGFGINTSLVMSRDRLMGLLLGLLLMWLIFDFGAPNRVRAAES